MSVTGTVLGDVLGSEKIGKSFSGISVTAIAVKKAMDLRTDFKEMMIQLIREHPYVVEDKSLLNWANGNNHYPYYSCTSDSATRVAYLGEHFSTLEEIQGMAAMVAGITHNHPEGIKGAVVTATCAWMATYGSSKRDIYKYVLKEYPCDQFDFSIIYSLEEIKLKLAAGEIKCENTCQCCVPLAMRCFYESEDFDSFIENVNSLPFDSRILGAIGGGVTEHFYCDDFEDTDVEDVVYCYLSRDLLAAYDYKHAPYFLYNEYYDCFGEPHSEWELEAFDDYKNATLDEREEMRAEKARYEEERIWQSCVYGTYI